MKRVMFLIYICLSVYCWSIKEYHYEEMTEDTITVITYVENKTDRGFEIKNLSADGESVFITDDNYSILEHRYVNEENSSLLKYVVKDSKIFLHENIIANYNPEKELWFGSTPHLKDFIKNEKKRQTAFFITPEYDEKGKPKKNIKKTRIVAERKNIELLKINGKEVKAVKVKVSLGGLLAGFWWSFYWYRVSDGILVKYEEYRGRPNRVSPTIGVLVAEKDF